MAGPLNKLLALVVVVAGAGLLWLFFFLFRPLLDYPRSASLDCLDPEAGHFEALGAPTQVYGLGLSYAGHIAESPGLYEPGAPPPVFRKHLHTVNRSAEVDHPSAADLVAAAARVDAAHAVSLQGTLENVPPLLDYEVEIGLAVIEPIAVEALDDPTFAPPVGYFVANDLTARILIAMAPDVAATVDYLAEGKGLRGFLPVGDRLWIPDRFENDAWICVELITEVNGAVRQRSSSRDIIVGPREILRTVAAHFDLARFEEGDWIVTGTPPGVALQTPGWMQRALLLWNPSAQTKIAAMAGAAADGGFLQPGDEVVVRAGFLGEKRTRVREAVRAGPSSGSNER